MNILVSGGTGYIGSHTVVELIAAGHSVVIVDNLVNSNEETIDKIFKISGVKPIFYKVDCTDHIKLEAIFKLHQFDGIIHFAGLKAVGESVSIPLAYYYNNLVSTINLSQLAIKYGVNKFVFSSSATVYGDQKVPFSEDMELLPTTNPYGETKAMSERILKDTAQVNKDFKVSILRYFNPVGAHSSGLIGEQPNGIPNNLMPYIQKVANKKLPILSIYGNDYDTPDGTGVRDYIHVVDLAKGHVLAIEKLLDSVEVYNLGTGIGVSVLELLTAFEKANKIEIPYKIVGRRPGDISNSYADATKAYDKLGWKAEKTILDMCKDTWKFEKSNKA
ncbi:UDP-glucose 4-epimerase GalE [Mariniplasma anaerobium]|uniref:UDP-glucose 4-epimerase n=1 Tax=Mariniplasma anaerobium TaxID=2735436 RepID=A0A7U9XVS9_9MOLU|nr:UDP-glucose 4-epimerase GalE [Mariniplasma anaerobium]BCR36060.1 UDP-glucose 4-epimerase [Mariniplasma anaerobium]